MLAPIKKLTAKKAVSYLAVVNKSERRFHLKIAFYVWCGNVCKAMTCNIKACAIAKWSEGDCLVWW